MALAWKAGWVKALRGSNPLSSATVIERDDPERVPHCESGGHATALLRLGITGFAESFPETGSTSMPRSARSSSRSRYDIL